MMRQPFDGGASFFMKERTNLFGRLGPHTKGDSPHAFDPTLTAPTRP